MQVVRWAARRSTGAPEQIFHLGRTVRSIRRPGRPERMVYRHCTCGEGLSLRLMALLRCSWLSPRRTWLDARYACCAVDDGRALDTVRFHVSHNGSDVDAATSETRSEDRAGPELVSLVVQHLSFSEVSAIGCTGDCVLSTDEVGGKEGLAFDLVVLGLELLVFLISFL